MSLEQYRREIHADEKYSPMSPDEEKKLARLARKGDLAAQTEFIERNLRLVLSISEVLRNKYLLSDDEQLDMIQTGNMKLKNYLRGFKPTYKFSTYCYDGLKRDMQRVIDLSRPIRIPANIMRLSRKIYAVSMDYFNKHGKSPTNEELAEIIDETPEQIEHVRFSLKNTRSVSKDVPISSDSEASIGDFLEGDNGSSISNQITGKQSRLLLVRYMDRLTERERGVIIERYFHNLPPLEIADKLGIPRERVKQAESIALRKMKGYLKGDKTASSRREFQQYLREYS